jgi:hypothetical protein
MPHQRRPPARRWPRRTGGLRVDEKSETERDEHRTRDQRNLRMNDCGSTLSGAPRIINPSFIIRDSCRSLECYSKRLHH